MGWRRRKGLREKVGDDVKVPAKESGRVVGHQDEFIEQGSANVVDALEEQFSAHREEGLFASAEAAVASTRQNDAAAGDLHVLNRFSWVAESIAGTMEWTPAVRRRFPDAQSIF